MRLRIEASPAPLDRGLQLPLLGFALVTFAAARWFPFSSLPPLCLWRRATGQPCLTCGMTRSWVHVVHGRWADAWTQNPLGTVLCVTTAVWVLVTVVRLAGGPALVVEANDGVWTTFRWSIVAAFLVNWAWVSWTGVAG